MSAGELHRVLAELYPICRSITGDGVRQTLGILSEIIPLEIVEVPTGTAVFDWIVPNEWNVKDAWIKDKSGKKVVDFAAHNLHLVSYSEPLHQTMSFDELRPHLHTLPDRPEFIPYRTSYYERNWGFCLADAQLQTMQPGQYEVFIDSTLQRGALTYGEYVIPGKVNDEILIFSHVCHPSLANDNLSGLVVNSFLANQLTDNDNHYTYRFVFAPGTIGSITWLAQNESQLQHIRGGLVSVLLGGNTTFTYKKSRNGNAHIDLVVPFVLTEMGHEHDVLDFEPYGYDERQFGSPGIALDIGRLTRAPNNQFDEYHSSADNIEFVTSTSLKESLALMRRILAVFDANRKFLNLQPKCEPQLGRRGLYAAIGGQHVREQEHALLWVLNQSDGQSSLLDIAQTSGLEFDLLCAAAERLVDAGLIADAEAL